MWIAAPLENYDHHYGLSYETNQVLFGVCDDIDVGGNLFLLFTKADALKLIFISIAIRTEQHEEDIE